METQTVNATNLKLKEFFVDQLKDIYWTEKELFKTLPRLQDAASTPELKEAFSRHHQEAQTHVERLEKVFGLVNERIESTRCSAIADIMDEGTEFIDETKQGTAQRDTVLIFTSQKADHYKIATYNGLVNLASNIGFGNAADILRKTLTEEKEADALLTRVAERNVNYQLN